MKAMGAHTAIANGHRGEDGAATVPSFPSLDMSRLVPLRGPVSDLARNGHDIREDVPSGQDNGPVTAETVTGIRIDGDRLRRGAMWLLASGVAAIAAVVSYSHIYDLGRAHGGSGTAARLLPLSVDMLILVGELMLLHEADRKGRRFVLGWVLVWSGILATLAANVSFGAQFGVAGAVIWGWPAYSFILAAGGMVSVVKRGSTRDIPEPVPVLAEDMGTGPAPVIQAATQADIPADIPAVTEGDKPLAIPAAADSPRTAPVTRPARRTPTGQERAASILRRNPGLSGDEVARRAGVSVKTVSRARAGLEKASS